MAKFTIGYLSPSAGVSALAPRRTRASASAGAPTRTLFAGEEVRLAVGDPVSLALPSGRERNCEVAAVRRSPVHFVELRPIGGGSVISLPVSRLRQFTTY